MRKLSVLLVLSFLFPSCGSGQKMASATSETSQMVVVSGNLTEVKKEDNEVISKEKPLDTVSDSLKIEEAKDSEEKPMESTSKTIISTQSFNHSVWDGLLKEYVSIDGRVNYEGLRQSKGILRDYISSLGANIPDESWSKEDELAYWMNAYNAMTVDLILRNLPLESIKDIANPWDQRLWKLDDKWYNLEEIEHQILRKMKDPRIHFGINCASFSCPPLMNEAFTSEAVDSQLDHLTRSFINDTERNTISENSIEISKIFSWFAKDFKTEGTIIDFLNKYSTITINSKARKSYKKYDWSLNK